MSGGVNRDIVCKWQDAVEAVENGRLKEAARLFWDIRDFSAKIWFNLSIIDLLLGDFTAADERLKECLQRDAYLVVAYFQRGVIACQQGRLSEGKEMFTLAQKNLRIGDSIDYKQLGLSLRLTRQQMQHNLTAVQAYLTAHRTTTKIPKEELEIPTVDVFRPARGLVDNIEKKNFLQKARVISSVPDIVQKKDGVVNSARSLSAPTSPAGQRKLTGNIQVQAALTPPPSRPPPRLPPPAIRHAASGNHRHGNSNRKEAELKQSDLKSAVGLKPGLPDDTNSSCLCVSALTSGRPLRSRSPLSQAMTHSMACQCRGVGAVSRCDVCSGARGSNSAAGTSSLSSQTPSAQSQVWAAADSSDPQLSVSERIRQLKLGSMGDTNEEQSVSGVEPPVQIPGQDVKVRGERSWPSKGTDARPKPARPPLPKFA